MRLYPIVIKTHNIGLGKLIGRLKIQHAKIVMADIGHLALLLFRPRQ